MLGRSTLGLALVTLCALTPCGSAYAHGTPPTAYAVVAHDAQGALAVRLSTGLALRRGAERFQFVCPAAWGDEYAAPLAALDDGTIVVGATEGLKLLAADGTLRPHPDPAAAGISTELVRNAHGVFSLRITAAGSELLAITSDHVRVLWQDSKSWYSLAALPDSLLLLRSNSASVEQLTISATDGAELEHQQATLAKPVDYVFARGAAGAPYALLLFQNAPELGSLHMNTFTKVSNGLSSVAGPLKVGDKTLLAIDGQLSELTASGTSARSEGGYVMCLDDNGGLTYACQPDGIVRVSAEGLGEPLFELSWLVPPNLEHLATGKPRERCDYQWQDMRFDLLALGTTLSEDVAPTADAGGPVMADAGQGGVVDAGVALDAGSEGAEPAEAGAPDAGRPRGRDKGCGVSLSERGQGGAGLCLLLLLALRGLARRSTRAIFWP